MLSRAARRQVAVHQQLPGAACGSAGRGHGRLLSTTASRRADFAHVVIGAGVVGLAVSRALARRNPATLVVERHARAGQETSSRNSEVIHAGIYYPAGSLKTALCVRGRALLYAYCAARGVPHRNTGKLVVAQTPRQLEALARLHDHCAAAAALEGAAAVRWVGAAELAAREPLVRARAGCLESPATGIVDSHALMAALLGELEDAGGTFSPGGHVVGVAPCGGGGGGARGGAGWEVTVRDAASGEAATVTADVLVNAAGLGACDVHNMVVVPRGGAPLRTYYAKGNYFSCSPAPRVGTLVYPAPEPGGAGLGTHLTLDMAGRVRFGPDVEWVGSPADLAPSPAPERLAAAADAIRSYLPGLDPASLAPDYAGIRPKLAPAGFCDFVVRREPGYDGWVNLLGIESPGLTSALAIGEMVEGLLYR